MAGPIADRFCANANNGGAMGAAGWMIVRMCVSS